MTITDDARKALEHIERDASAISIKSHPEPRHIRRLADHVAQLASVLLRGDPLYGVERPDGCGPDGEPLAPPDLGPAVNALASQCGALEHLLEVWEREYQGESPYARSSNRISAMHDAVDEYRAIYPVRR